MMNTDILELLRLFWCRENDYSDNFETAGYKWICLCLKVFSLLLQIMKRVIAALMTEKSTNISVGEKTNLEKILGHHCHKFFLNKVK